MDLGRPKFERYRLVAITLAAYAMIGSLLVIAGWEWNLPRLTDWGGHGISMKFNPGLAAFLCGAAIILLQWRRESVWIARALALAVTCIGGLTLFEHITGINIGIDTLFFKEPPGMPATVAPGRMGPPAAVCFLLLGAGLLLATGGPKARRIGSFLGVIVCSMVGISLTGYLFDADLLYTVAQLTAIAAQTAAFLLALGAGLVMLVPESGVFGTLRRQDAGGLLVRRMIVPLVALPLLLGYLRVRGQELGLYDHAFGNAIFAFTMTACLGIIMFKTATRLGAAEEALRQADRRKDDFLATLAHELRNPLAPIRHSLEILKRSEGNAAATSEARSTMERQLSHMVRLIDDLLDVSRITQDRLLLHREPVELGAILRQSLETIRPQMDCARHQMTVAIPPEPIYLHADSVRLVQVFGNLLHNACKYTPQGGRISLTVAQENHEACIRIADNGMGIPRDMLEKVFDMFTQVEPPQRGAQSGLGIGLSLAKRLVELHGGTIAARSEGVGKGSEFVVRLPVLAQAPELLRPPKTPSPAPPRRVLVVDDNLDAARSLARLLKLEGHDAEVAHDGMEAIEKAAAYKPEVILLDIGMPQMNGYDACRKIREEPWGERIKIIALTGWGQQEDRRKTRDAGFDAHLVKPVDLETLREMLTDNGNPGANQKQAS
jgi:signal transduction histidine kinase/CheY-like chemotaxis protein